MLHMIRVVVGSSLLMLGQVDLAQTGNEYFPLKQKTKWTYKVQDQIVEVQVSGTEKINNEDCAKVDTIVNNKVVASEWYAVRADGIYRVKVKDDKIDPPVKILEIPAKKGKEWEVKSKVGNQSVAGKFKITDDAAKVNVPAGFSAPGFTGTAFNTVVVEGVDMDIAGTKATVKTWYAKGIGIVKLSFKIQDAESVLELTKFEEGK